MHRVDIDRGSAPVAVLAAHGELDAFAAPDLERALRELVQGDSLVVDLEAVSFLDSTALGVIVRTVHELESRGDGVRIVLPRGSARRIFEITTLDSALPVAEGRVQAVVALTSAA